jgi:hypothetical protein
MCNRIPYKTIVACKLGDEEALLTILKHYEPLIIESSKKKIVDGSGMTTYVVDEDVKAYIISELTMAIMMKYDPTRIPRNRRAPGITECPMP